MMTDMEIYKPKKSKATKHIDKDIFEGLCKILCTVDEIVSILNCDRLTLKKWAKKTYGKTLELVMSDYQAEGKASFRRTGIKLAESGSAPVWIFLAKNWLGMSDNPAPLATGEESKELAKAINTAAKSLAKADISDFAQIPDSANGEKPCS